MPSQRGNFQDRRLTASQRTRGGFALKIMETAFPNA